MILYNFMILYMYIAFMHFIHLLQVSKNVFEDWFYTIFHDLIHVYSPGTGADSPQGTKFWYKTERPYHFTHLLEHPMLQTKFQGHQPFGSEEEDFLRFLGWPGLFKHTFVSPSHEDSIWNLASIGPVVSEEKTFKECGRQTDYLSYKLTNEGLDGVHWLENNGHF